MKEKKRILTEQEFAKEVRWHKETIAQMRREGKIDHCKSGRKVWYVWPEHVESFIHRFERKADAA